MSTRKLQRILSALLLSLVGIVMFFAFVFTLNDRPLLACGCLLLSPAIGVLAALATPEEFS